MAERLSEMLAGRTWFRVIVTGSRTWDDRDAIWEALDELLREHRMVQVVHGSNGRGADAYASEWVTRTLRSGHQGVVQEELHPADWEQFGSRAGFIRNAEMVSTGAQLVLAFIDQCRKAGCPRGPAPHGSHGAEHCATLAEKAGIPARRISADG